METFLSEDIKKDIKESLATIEAEAQSLLINLRIDRNDLDGEINRQIDLQTKIIALMHDCLFIRDMTNKKEDEIYAKVNLAVRSKLVYEKITEEKIKQLTLVNQDVIDIKDIALTAKNTYDSLLNIKELIVQRNYLIRELASLWIAGYYTITTSNKPLSDETLASLQKRR